MRDERALVRLEAIEKTFGGRSLNQMRLFSDFNLSIREGEFVSVVGSNGSGKTTLLNLICGNVTPDKGKIYLEERDITKMPQYKRAGVIGRVYQDPKMGTCPALTILENMSLADNKGKPYQFTRGVNRKRADRYRTELEKLHLGLENKLHVPVGMLSGGQRQALALLLASMTPLKLLVLDEHTAALDPNSSRSVMELTKELVEKLHLTTIMVTHNLKFASIYGDRLLMMHHGNVVLDISGEEKQAYQTRQLLEIFNRYSLEADII